ncbi:MAG: PEGA domain-containing protein [Planctomycetota bacterium]|nr:PEGA domain-containing protein [Planctomycetota bacterium]
MLLRTTDRTTHSSRNRFVAGLLMVALLFASGCVQRRLTIRSNPPGARVYIGDQEIGTTPVSTEFVYYGDRKIRLALDGYETLVVNQPIPTPWYQYFPLDFVSENLVPGEIRDERVVNYQLVPLQLVPSEILVTRAEQLRQSVQGGPIVPVAGVEIIPQGTSAPFTEILPTPNNPYIGPPNGMLSPTQPPGAILPPGPPPAGYSVPGYSAPGALPPYSAAPGNVPLFAPPGMEGSGSAPPNTSSPPALPSYNESPPGLPDYGPPG